MFKKFMLVTMMVAAMSSNAYAAQVSVCTKDGFIRKEVSNYENAQIEQKGKDFVIQVKDTEGHEWTYTCDEYSNGVYYPRIIEEKFKDENGSHKKVAEKGRVTWSVEERTIS